MSEVHTASRRPWSKRRATRSGGNTPSRVETVVGTLNVRGEIPAMPSAAIRASTVFTLTAGPRLVQCGGDPRRTIGAFRVPLVGEDLRVEVIPTGAARRHLLPVVVVFPPVAAGAGHLQQPASRLYSGLLKTRSRSTSPAHASR